MNGLYAFNRYHRIKAAYIRELGGGTTVTEGGIHRGYGGYTTQGTGDSFKVVYSGSQITIEPTANLGIKSDYVYEIEDHYAGKIDRLYYEGRYLKRDKIEIYEDDAKGAKAGLVYGSYDQYPNGDYVGDYWYSRFIEVPTTPSNINVPTTESGTTVTISWSPSTFSDGTINYQLERSIDGGSFSQVYYGTNTIYIEQIEETWNTVQYRVRARAGQPYSPEYKTSTTRIVSHNKVPTLMDTTSDDRTLYENDLINIKGNAKDTDSGDVVSVRYRINDGTARAIATGISDGVTSLAYNKTLKCTNKKLMDGATAITGDLAEGSQNTITVWAEDDKGGKSVEVTRVFYVVHNRPPVLTILPFDDALDLINTENITINGTVADPDGGNVKVKYRVGNTAFTEIFNGEEGEFSFDVTLSELKEGSNDIVIRAEDIYEAVTVKSVNLVKEKNDVPLKTSVVRYDLTPPNGSAKGVVLWVERETGDLNVEAEISMTNDRVENFQPMTKNLTAYVSAGKEEDEFIYEVPGEESKTNIVLKLTMTRADVESNASITTISGVLS